MPDDISTSQSGADTLLIPDSSTPRYVGPPPAPIDPSTHVDYTGNVSNMDFIDYNQPPESISPPEYTYTEAAWAGITMTSWGIMLLDADRPAFEANPHDNIPELISDMQGEGGYAFEPEDVEFLSEANSAADLYYRQWQLEDKKERMKAASAHPLAMMGGAIVDYDVILGGGIASKARAVGLGVTASRVAAGVGVGAATYGSFKVAEGRTPFTTEDMVLMTLLSTGSGMISKVPGAPMPKPQHYNRAANLAMDTESEMITAGARGVDAPVAHVPTDVPHAPVVGATNELTAPAVVSQETLSLKPRQAAQTAPVAPVTAQTASHAPVVPVVTKPATTAQLNVKATTGLQDVGDMAKYTTTSAALDNIISTGTELQQTFASKLKSMMNDTESRPMFRGDSIQRSYYTGSTQTVHMRGSAGTDIELHEIAHSLTQARIQYGLGKPDTPLGKIVGELDKLREHVIANASVGQNKSHEYFLKNNHEFISGVFEGRPEYIRMLSEMPSMTGKPNLLADIVEVIKRTLGVTGKEQSALTDLLNITDEMLKKPIKVRSENIMTGRTITTELGVPNG